MTRRDLASAVFCGTVAIASCILSYLWGHTQGQIDMYDDLKERGRLVTVPTFSLSDLEGPATGDEPALTDPNDHLRRVDWKEAVDRALDQQREFTRTPDPE